MKSFEEICNTSVLDLHLLTLEESRTYHLNQLVGNRFFIREYTAKELQTIFAKSNLHYTETEIQNMINMRGNDVR